MILRPTVLRFQTLHIEAQSLKDLAVSNLEPNRQHRYCERAGHQTSHLQVLPTVLVQVRHGHAGIQQTQRHLNATDEELRRGPEATRSRHW